ncbi:phosphate transport system regulatory protein PhoU [Robertmurraya siralis]|uniref:Phosphate-specific transport system accessory protein PhoU n=1 Tax=Robertmurraya siralis TaxID=77777 RepID=A0A920BTM5_9BACI|nr:phosphate signaling complex protein PhoU [Robertmurraya siralis]PAE19982.1 phosphate transport system regulatory protein PhoU [Bacillus sp. 7504-2]GIN62118.1 phosphate transport system regulatory protein PhoU [Robertmurraya siralis]
MVVRENFENSLQELQTKMTEMGELAISSLEKAFTAFKTQDIELALRVIEEDNEIDDLEEEINQFAIWLTVKEQPVARDLRKIIGAIKISSEIERIADFGVNIAKSAIKIGSEHSLISLTQLESMKDACINMLQKALQSFIDENIVLAKEVGDMDDVVDEYSNETYKQLTTYLSEHPEETNQLVQLLFINRYLERTADHITNIAESAAYLIKGRRYDLN